MAAALALAALLAAGGCGWGERLFPSDHADRPAPDRTAEGAVVPGTLEVKPDQASGGVAPVGSSLTADFRSVWVGGFLDPGPAERAAEVFRKRGLVAFTVQKSLVEKGWLASKPIGDYHLVLVGLFGEWRDAEDLGGLLKAQGLAANWQVVPTDRPAEISAVEAQTAGEVATSERVTEAARERSSRPLAPDAPAATGSGFRNLVRGRFVGSYRDPLEARKEAERLTAAGWPAAVESGADAGGAAWHRVWLSEPGDRREFRSQPAALSTDRASAASQEGLVLMVDVSGLKGVWGSKAPVPERTDASACAGYSRAGRTLTNLERLIGYVPETSLMVVVKPIARRAPDDLADRVVRPVRAWWTGDQSELTDSKSVYGPTVFNRPAVMARVRGLTAQPDPAPMGPAIDDLVELEAIPGRKTLVLYSDFGLPDGQNDALAAMGRLRARYGADLNVLVVYGDTTDAGWRMAEALAKAAGAGQAWNGCQLLADYGYFERFVKTVFRR
jgi:hypothetical protein